MDTVDGASEVSHEVSNHFQPMGFWIARFGDSTRFLHRRGGIYVEKDLAISNSEITFQHCRAEVGGGAFVGGTLASNDRLVTGNVIKTNMSKQCQQLAKLLHFFLFSLRKTVAFSAFFFVT